MLKSEAEVYFCVQEHSLLLNQLLKSIVCGELSQLKKIEVMMKLTSVDPELLSLALVRLQGSVLHSHWSRNVEAWLLLVESSPMP